MGMLMCTIGGMLRWVSRDVAVGMAMLGLFWYGWVVAQQPKPPPKKGAGHVEEESKLRTQNGGTNKLENSHGKFGRLWTV